MSDRLFDLEDVPEVPLFREPPPGRGALVMDERISHDYPPEWNRCPDCVGTGHRASRDGGKSFAHPPMACLPDDPHLKFQYGFTPSDQPWAWVKCERCLGMGSVKAKVRLLAGHRCERCHHPYVPKGDARMLGVEPTPHVWSPCDSKCEHSFPLRALVGGEWVEYPKWTASVDLPRGGFMAGVIRPRDLRRALPASAVEAHWRILTVHHLDGDKANLAWWNLAALCQVCHLHVQGKVVMERVYPHEHSEWFKPHAAGWYAKVYLGEDVSREEALERMDELLALERAA